MSRRRTFFQTGAQLSPICPPPPSALTVSQRHPFLSNLSIGNPLVPAAAGPPSPGIGMPVTAVDRIVALWKTPSVAPFSCTGEIGNFLTCPHCRLPMIAIRSGKYGDGGDGLGGVDLGNRHRRRRPRSP